MIEMMRTAMQRLFNRPSNAGRVLVLGLDCADPRLIFDDFRQDLPTLNRLMTTGTWGKLESSTPCITVPAWSSMLSSRDPGVLGFYGFRNRADYSYNKMQVANSSGVKVKRVWDYLTDASRQSLVVNVPQTYPLKPLNGYMVSGFLTPGRESAFAYPAILKNEVLKLAPEYPFDVKGFRTDDKAILLQRLIDFTEEQYRVFKHLLTTKPWDFAMHVNMGTDRLHHGFWRYHDPQHRAYQPDNPFKDAIRDYYKTVDNWLNALIEAVGDDVTVLVVSDHGVTRMDGGICINEWLWQQGWLHFKTPPPEGKVTRFDELEVDWSKTRAWGSGGYYARIFLNIAGREPQGIIPSEQAEQVKTELANLLKAIPGPDGEPLPHQIILPETTYSQVKNIPPDLMVYFGELRWRSVGSVGHGQHYTFENDTGPDDANHDTHGLFILHEPDKHGVGQVEGHQLMDIAPTILHRMGIAIPDEMQGRIIKSIES